MTRTRSSLVLATFLGAAVPCLAADPPVAAAAAATALAGQGDFVWMEGEQARNNCLHDRFYDMVPQGELSGGQWLSSHGDTVGQAEFRFSVATAGNYTGWVRCNIPNSTYRCALDGAELARLDLSGAQGHTTLAPQRVLAWVKIGPFALAAGEHTLRFVIDSALKNSGAVDCIALVSFAWTPAGIVQPDGLVADPTTVAAATTFPPFAVTSIAAPGKGDFVWIEGESPARHTFVKHYWYNNVGRDLLFNKDWLSHYGGQPAEAEYRFAVRKAGAYTWWLRCNPVESALTYRLDGGGATPIDTAKPRERMGLTEGGDLRAIGWINVGKLELAAGEHALTVNVASAKKNHGGIDCMALVGFAWVPAGFRMPDGTSADPSGNPPTSMVSTETAGGKEYVWVEGEAAYQTTANKHPWYSAVKKDLLSNKDWVCHMNPGEPAASDYKITVTEGGNYTWWVRCITYQAVLDYSLDGGAAVPIDCRDAREVVSISPDRDIRHLGWVRVAKLALAPGLHKIRVTFRSQNANHGGIDCMAFVNFPWAPAGTDKPSLAAESAPRQPDTWFAVVPDDDEFSPESITDLSALVGKPAGAHGFLRRSGASLVFDKQPETPVKFWGLCANMSATPATQEMQARLYAKHGLNMVRQNAISSLLGPFVKDAASGQRTLDAARLDRLDGWFAALKAQGLYMTWMMVYPHMLTQDDAYPSELYGELPNDGPGKDTTGFAPFLSQIQDAEWAWVKAVLTHTNPHTGLRYVDDPALAVVEIRNEDCVFWHKPLNQLAKMPRHRAVMQRMWMEWLQRRYATTERLKESWGEGCREGDAIDNPAMEIYAAWEMTPQGPTRDDRIVEAERRRLGDFIRFLAETQRAGYERRERLLRELGFKGVTTSTAWRAGGPAADPANLWCDDAMEMVTRHNYFGGGPAGAGSGGHNISLGKVVNDSHLTQPGSGILSIGLYQVEDKPFCSTEWSMLPPNQWKAEMAPLFAFYGMGLQGWDASYHFAGSRPRMGAGWPDLRSYATETPHYLGQFPALAFALYKNHIAEGAIAAARRVKVDDVFQGIDALSQDFTGGGYDAKALKGNLATPMETLAIGRVTAKIADGQPPSATEEWAKYWDRDARIVKSTTGQLLWDYGKRVVTVRTEKTQAIIGFAGGGEYDLPGVKVQVKTPFVSLLFTPLDDRPLAASKHILVTAMARDKQTGTEYNADGSELLAMGTPPLLMEPIQATLTFKGDPVASVKTVDIYGVPTETAVARSGNAFTIDGQYATYYYEVRR